MLISNLSVPNAFQLLAMLTVCSKRTSNPASDMAIALARGKPEITLRYTLSSGLKLFEFCTQTTLPLAYYSIRVSIGYIRSEDKWIWHKSRILCLSLNKLLIIQTS
ncbi:hypothetical protein RF11_08442 [Thelohanellus kitauei]|uniref:Uncharacterized protein n=1 Tax=Thelohanellus kitauei TaxID=669202 RepID=A0A0C2IHX6_THEKT|nr:hypothetical protein RF11_08442 [Thelohanellus kitauei]